MLCQFPKGIYAFTVLLLTIQFKPCQKRIFIISKTENDIDNLKATAEAEKRLLEDTIRALREKLENSAADTLAQIENLRADQDGNRREAERNIQALRNKLEQQRNQYEEITD